MFYINGIKATKKDLRRLFLDVKKGVANITTARTTKKGAIALTVKD